MRSKADTQMLQITSPAYIETPQPKIANNIKWHKKNEELTIHGYKINGLVYTATKQQTRKDVINLNAKVNQEDDSSQAIGYWPSYGNLSPSQRACYLNFLQNGSNSNANVGYAFLYLYGLEYRLIYEEALDEYDDIVNEITKLREIFSQNSSFEYYSTNLLVHAFLLKHKNGDITQSLDYNSLLLKYQTVLDVIIAELTLKGLSIPAELVYHYISQYPSRAVMRRCEDEFKKVFIDVFQSRYDDGYKCKMKKREFQPNYRACSGDFYKNTYKKLPNIVGDSFVSKFDNIIDGACNALAKYSRFVINGSKNSLYAKALLPLNFIQNDESVKEYFTNIKLGTFHVSQIAQSFLLKDSLLPAEFQNISDFHNKFGLVCKMSKPAQTITIAKEEQNYATEPVKIGEGDIARGFAIPQKQSNTREEKVFLDIKLIEQKMQETKEVATALSDVFQGNEDVSVYDNKVDDENDYMMSFLKVITEKMLWSRYDLELLARKHKIFLDSFIETMNDKSLEMYDSTVIDENEESVIIDEELVHKILTKNTI